MPYSGADLQARFGDTLLSGRYKSFAEAEEATLRDQSGYADRMRNHTAELVEGSVSIETLQEAGGYALWDAVEVGTTGVLEWIVDSTETYTVEAVVKERKRSVIVDDVVKIMVTFGYVGTPETGSQLYRYATAAITLGSLTLSAGGEITGEAFIFGTAAITLTATTLSAAGTVAEAITTGPESMITLGIGSQPSIRWFVLTGLHPMRVVVSTGTASITLADTTLSSEGEVTATLQYARPDGTITSTGVADGDHTDIDEVTASDADYLYGTDDTNVTYICSIGNVTDPSTGFGHQVKYRIAKTDGGVVDGDGSTTYATISLLQGDTVIGSDSQRTLTGDWTTYTWSLSEAQGNSITDYTDLRLRVYSPASGGEAVNRRSVGVSWMEFRVPGVS